MLTVADGSLTDDIAALVGEVTHLLGFVGLNLSAVRKILKKMAKHVAPQAPVPGYLALEILNPHDPEYRVLQVG